MTAMSTAAQTTTDEQREMIRQSAADFARTHIFPHVMDWDERQHFPRELFHQMGEYGFMGVLVPEQYGGTGLSYAEYITVIDEIAQVCGSIGLSVAAHNSLCTNHILQFGSEAQKNKYLPALASGEHLGAWGLTEPNTGSDAGRMRTVAERQEDGGYILNGAKNFITHGISAEVAVVIARTGELLDSHGMTAFIVERGDEGFRGGKKEDKLGMRASETAEIIFENCYLPADRILGEVGEGFIQSMKILDGGRISIAALSLGIAKGAMKAALAYSQEREQFGKAISRFQSIAFKLSDMATEIEASELLTRNAGRLKDAGLPMTRESAMAKLFASETCVRVANDTVQIFGGYGFTKEYPAEKYYRDCKLCTIGEGTSEIQRLVISRELLKK
ncbi:alkylation response protein AidB-like acyl-CoA dehydrogenase [Lewinella aquimaris]|uniref:Cyclohex-1-ene-1-carbonyl-CoA dehydrogenase n=1 Tax=Neolewinella aquimaris TaxID=1835722 RepID=A0A840E080_9BACT|nr:acyl-CoA dehydrogenase family protein [Neolewinella aquimaris]MBB4078560.1 alkylation response protein AidB-like acyl-CoA dehydrogenase [Neolewinella aquimaris]